jgi:photosystem II stability/assembly factor-like uncharacterized protein
MTGALIEVVYQAPSRRDEKGCVWYERLSDASFPSAQVAWAVGSRQILRSVDRGLTWTNYYARLPPDAGLIPSRVFALNENQSWVISTVPLSSNRVYQTKDGGESWKAVEVDSFFYPNAVFFIDHRRGWVIGDDASLSAPEGLIQTTIDGGKSWKTLSLGFVGRPTRLHFFNKEKGFLVLDKLSTAQNRYHSSIYHSSNSGKTWTFTCEFGWQITSVCLLKESRFFVTGDSGLIAETLDGGLSWNIIKRGAHGSFNSVDFYRRNGAVAGDSGVLLLSTDDGKAWKRSRTREITSNLVRVHYTAGDELLLVGENAIYRRKCLV